MKILGSNYAIKLMNRHEANEVGNCCFCSQVIRLQSDMCAEARLETLWHEIVEAVNTKLELDLEHKQISGIGTAIHSVLKENGINADSLLRGVK